MDYAIKIDEQSGKDLTDYQIRIEITDEEFFSKCTDQKFVEFYDEDKQTLLSHYTELFDTANKIAIFWVKVPSIPANGTKMIYLNINTSRTEDLSDPEAVFDFWDDFETADYTVIRGDANQVSIVNNTWLRIDATTGVSDKADIIVELNKETSLTTDFIVEGKVYSEKPDEWVGFFTETNGNGYACGWYGWGGSKGSIERWDSWNRKGLQDEIPHYLYPQGSIQILRWDRVGNELRMWDTDLSKVIATQMDSTYDSFTKMAIRCYRGGIWQIDWVRVRKFTDPEPSVTVIRLRATPTYDLKLKIAQALSGESDTILDTDPKLRLLSGTDIIKELSLTAKTVYKDSTNNRVVVAFLFVDDSSDSYTTDNQELLFTKDNTEYVAFKSSKTFTKEADKRLPLRWEIYLNYDVDVCTYEESMVTCL